MNTVTEFSSVVLRKIEAELNITTQGLEIDLEEGITEELCHKLKIKPENVEHLQAVFNICNNDVGNVIRALVVRIEEGEFEKYDPRSIRGHYAYLIDKMPRFVRKYNTNNNHDLELILKLKPSDPNLLKVSHKLRNSRRQLGVLESIGNSLYKRTGSHNHNWRLARAWKLDSLRGGSEVALAFAFEFDEKIFADTKTYDCDGMHLNKEDYEWVAGLVEAKVFTIEFNPDNPKENVVLEYFVEIGD